MLDPVVKVEGLWKRYHKRFGTSTLWSFFGAHERADDEFWALKDVSFDVRPGECLGIIGANGSGKSTLLKVLSRITVATRGRVAVNGRVASLLEVGTGFHPELTGRDNVFLSGAVLGMSRAEIRKRFDEIVEFSGVEDFIDVPVKRYSSGMYVRLAFAVAANIRTDVLIVDEVLAVGDAAFQKRCLGKMGDVGKAGRTILFVSHNMPSIVRLCNRAILLKKGRVALEGPAYRVVNEHLGGGDSLRPAREWPDLGEAPGSEVVRLRAVRIRAADGCVSDAIDIRSATRVEMEYEVLAPGHVFSPGFFVNNDEGNCIFASGDTEPTWRRQARPVGRYVSTAVIPGNFLAEGRHFIRVYISSMEPLRGHVDEHDVVSFHVADSLDGDAVRGDYAGPMPGVVRPWLEWNTVHPAGGSSVS